MNNKIQQFFDTDLLGIRYDIMTVMDSVKYYLGIYELNKDNLSESYIEYCGKPMQKAIEWYNRGYRRKDMNKMSIMADTRMIIKSL